jgi:hypothetical protein
MGSGEDQVKSMKSKMKSHVSEARSEGEMKY